MTGIEIVVASLVSLGVVGVLLWSAWRRTPKPAGKPSKGIGAKVRIKVVNLANGTQVWLDDKKVRGLRNVTFQHPVGDTPLLVLELISTDIEIEGFVSELFTMSNPSGDDMEHDRSFRSKA